MSTKDELGLRLCVLVSFYLAATRCCQIEKVRSCKDYSLLQNVDFAAYIPPLALDSFCQRLHNALSCIYATGRLDQCPSSFRLPFDTQGGVIATVCGERKQDYLWSGQCFNGNGVKTSIARECFSVLTNSTLLDPCRTISWVVDCAQARIMMTDRCRKEDAALMRDLVKIYLRPSWDISNCPYAAKMTNGTAAKNHVRDKANRRSTRRTVQLISTSQEPRREENTLKSAHSELASAEAVTITKPGTQRTNLKTIPMMISDEDDDEPQYFFESATSELQEQTRSDKDLGTESSTSSSPSGSTESTYPGKSGPGEAKTTSNQSDLNSSIQSTLFNYIPTTSSVFPSASHEQQVEKRTLKNQTATSLGKSATRVNKNGVSARTLMSTQGSSGTLGICAPLQVSLLVLNAVLFL